MRKFYLFSTALVVYGSFHDFQHYGEPGNHAESMLEKKKDGKAINCGYCHGNNANKY